MLFNLLFPIITLKNDKKIYRFYIIILVFLDNKKDISAKTYP